MNYLYTIARNKCNDERKKKRNEEVCIDYVCDELSSETEQTKTHEEQLDIEEAVNDLPDDLREVIILYYTKLGRSKGTKAKILAGLVMGTVVYWLFMVILSLISFGIMGISGAATPIQMEYSYCMYALTFLQQYLVIIFAGYIGSMLAVTIAMFVSAKSHSAILAICFPFIIFVVSPFIGRVMPWKGFFNVTPDQLINVYNCIRLPLIYQFGSSVVMQIPMIMVTYFVLTFLILPFIYFTYRRYKFQ